MATNDTQTNSRRSPTPLQPTSPVEEDTTSQPHPPLQYNDPQRFRDCAHSINFEDDDFSIDDMFANPLPLPEPEIPSIVQQAEQSTKQQAHDYPPARGTGLGKTGSRPQKRVRVDTPQPGREESGRAVREELDSEGARPRKKVRFDMPRADEESGGDDSVRDSLEGAQVRPQSLTHRDTRQADEQGDEGNSSDGRAWSVDSAVGDGEESDQEQDLTASCDQKASLVQEREQ